MSQSQAKENKEKRVPKTTPKLKVDLAEVFVNWMISEDVQKTIADYKILGKQLFTPNAK